MTSAFPNILQVQHRREKLIGCPVCCHLRSSKTRSSKVSVRMCVRTPRFQSKGCWCTSLLPPRPPPQATSAATPFLNPRSSHCCLGHVALQNAFF